MHGEFELVVMFVVGTVLLPCTVTANDIHVCATCAHHTIQSAVNDAAVSADTIDIAAGSYSENVTVAGKQLKLLGAAGGASGITRVSAVGRGPVFTLGSGVAGDVNRLIEIRNLTISNGNHTGGTGVGGGIQVRAGAYLHVFDSIVMQNTASSGAGIGINSPGAPTTTLSGCLIDDNVTGGPGGGVAVLQGSSASIDQTTVVHNVSSEGGGIYGATGSTLTITNTLASGNTANFIVRPFGKQNGDGGGLQTSGDFSISDSFFSGNTATGESGGGGIEILLADNGPHTISRTTISHNSVNAGSGGGISASGGSGMSWTLSNSFVIQNLAGAGVVSLGPDDLVLTNTVIRGNVGGDLCTGQGSC
jgi:hypothetical protein